MASYIGASTYTPVSSVSSGYGQNETGFSVKATVLYIGLSVGVLIVVLALLGISLLYCVRPAERRRQQVILAARRQRAAGVQAAKLEEEDFKPQLRPLPVVVLQPGEDGVAVANLLSGNHELCEAPTAAADPAPPAYCSADGDPEKAESSLGTASDGASAEESSASSRGRRSEDSGGIAKAEKDAVVKDGEGSPESPGASQNGDELQHNPLTHYMTGRNASYFVADIHL